MQLFREAPGQDCARQSKDESLWGELEFASRILLNVCLQLQGLLDHDELDKEDGNGMGCPEYPNPSEPPSIEDEPHSKEQG